MPATCQVEVESGKTLENAGLYTIRGKRAFFFELLPELAKSEQVRISMLRVDDHPIAWQLELLQRANPTFIIWLTMKSGKNILRVSSFYIIALSVAGKKGERSTFCRHLLLTRKNMPPPRKLPTNYTGSKNQSVAVLPAV